MKMLVCVVMFAASIAAQNPVRDASPAAASPVGTAAITGTVVDESAHPLRRASVTITNETRVDLTTITDDAGRFAFEDLPPGRFTITAKKPAYPAASYGAKRPNRLGSGVLLTAGQRLTNLTLTLGRGGALAGTVFDDRGQPMPGVPIMAWEVRTNLAGDRTLGFPATGAEAIQTDDRGEYRVFGLPPGEYTIGTAWFYSGLNRDLRVPTDAEIQAAFEAFTRPPGTPQSTAPVASADRRPAPTYNYSPVFMPGSIDPLSATTVRLTVGEERTGLDLHMQFMPMAKIHGTVIAPSDPSASTELILFRRSQVDALNKTTFWQTADGIFESQSVAPGDYTIEARRAGGANRTALYALADVTIDGPTSPPVTLRLAPSMTLTGRIVLDSTSAGATPDLSRAVIRLPMLGAMSSASPEPATVNASGTFTINGVLPGTCRVSGSLPAPAGAAASTWTLESAILDGIDVTDVRVPITADRPPTNLTLTFTDRVAELSGALTDAQGHAMTDYFIVVLPADRRYWVPSTRRIVSARPDAQGRYLFRGLPPGDYRIAATTDLVSQDLADASALELLMAQSQPVTIGAGEHPTFDIRIAG